jgi:hypothetical protein
VEEPKESLPRRPPPSGKTVALVLIALVLGVCAACVLGTLGYGWFMEVKFNR